MPDPVVPDAQPAAPSAAAASTPVSDSDPLERLSEQQLQDWRMTGALPTDAPIPASSAGTPPAEPVVQAASTDVGVEAATAAADPALNPKTKERIDQVLADRAKERDRADRAERRIHELEARHAQPPTDARPAAPSAAPAGLVKPDPESFPYGTADPGYLEALTDYKVAATLATERQTWEAGQTEARLQDDHRRVMTAFEEKVIAARATHTDFDAVAMLVPTDIPQGSATDLWVLEDEAGAEILYHLQQPANAGERRRILALGLREQLKELVRLGDRLTAAAPPARSTSAPPPPPTLLTRPTPADPVERALAAGDSDAATGAWMAAENARELQRLKR